MKTDIFGESIAESQPSPKRKRQSLARLTKPKKDKKAIRKNKGPLKRDNPHRTELYAGKFKNEDEWNRVILT